MPSQNATTQELYSTHLMKYPHTRSLATFLNHVFLLTLNYFIYNFSCFENTN